MTYAARVPARCAHAMARPRRSWLFVPGADAAAHETATTCGADVLIQELEDFTPHELRPAARALARTLYDRWRWL